MTTPTPTIRRPVSSPIASSADALAQQALEMDVPTPSVAEAPPPPPPASEAKPLTEAEFQKLPPIERWRLNLKSVGITEAEAGKIIDAQIDPGFWSKSYTVMYGKIRMVLRTRDGLSRYRAISATDRLQNPTEVTYNQTLARVNLINSLQEYQGPNAPLVSLPFPPKNATIDQVDQAYTQRAAVVDSLSDAVLGVMLVKLMEFDRLVACALAEGATEGFWVPAGA